jgi:hypothetical protein
VITGAVSGTFGAVTGEYVPTYGAGSVTVRRAGGDEPKAPAVTTGLGTATAGFAPAPVAGTTPGAAPATTGTDTVQAGRATGPVAPARKVAAARRAAARKAAAARRAVARELAAARRAAARGR